MGLNSDAIFIDRQSGKDFNRTNYQLLKSILKKDDLLIVKSIDRLGRNYKMIIEEWTDITKNLEANILVLDMPLLDTRIEGHNLVGKFISDIVLQILSFVAQTERENIKLRQAEGIRLAREKGVHLGRPRYKLPQNFNEIAFRFQNNEINNLEAAKILNMTRPTFLKYAKIFSEGHHSLYYQNEIN